MDWNAVAAVGQCVGAAASFAAVVAALKIAGRDRARHDAEAQAIARGQAAMVIAVPRGGYGFAVTNYGARPVRDVHVVSVSLPNDSQAKYLNGNPLGRRPTIDVLPADGQNKLLDGMFIREFPGKDGAAGGSQAMQWPHESEIDYTLQYTDNDGHTWRRRCSELPELHTGDSLTAA